MRSTSPGWRRRNGRRPWPGSLTDDRAQGFDLARPPLLRLSLVRLEQQRWVLVFTNHHILLDGWSMPVLVRELLALYAQGGDPAGLPPVTPYRDYLAWLSTRDRAVAEEAWAEALAGLEQPTRLAASGRRPHAGGSGEHHARGARRRRRRPPRRGPASGRDPQHRRPGRLGSAAGPADRQPRRGVRGHRQRPPGGDPRHRDHGRVVHQHRAGAGPAASSRNDVLLLARLQDEQSQLAAHQHLGLADIQRVAGVGELFDTLTVFESYPRDPSNLQAQPGGMRITAVRGASAPHYPLSLIIVPGPGPRLRLKINYRTDLIDPTYRFDRAHVGEMLGQLVHLLAQIAEDPDRPHEGYSLVTEQSLLVLPDPGAPLVEQSYPPVADMIDSWVAASPDAVAVEQGDHAYTYAQLRAWADDIGAASGRPGAERRGRGNAIRTVQPGSGGGHGGGGVRPRGSAYPGPAAS